jgi:glycosyltransferase involved in cell wall biosynthesis
MIRSSTEVTIFISFDFPLRDPMQSLKANSRPTISIIVPNYNYGAFLPRCLGSIRNQSYKHYQLIVIDGGSTDQTLSVIQDNKDIIDVFISEPDEGMTDALNKGQSWVKGEIFTWLNADDALRPNALEVVVQIYLNGFTMIAGSCCDHHQATGHQIITKSPKTSYLSYFNFVRTSFHGFFPQPACFVASNLVARVFPLEKELIRAMDYQYFLRILRSSPRIYYTDNVLADFYYHGANITLSSSSLKNELIHICKGEIGSVGWPHSALMQHILNKNILLSEILESNSLGIGPILDSFCRYPGILFSVFFWKFFIKSILGFQKYL